MDQLELIKVYLKHEYKWQYFISVCVILPHSEAHVSTGRDAGFSIPDFMHIAYLTVQLACLFQVLYNVKQLLLCLYHKYSYQIDNFCFVFIQNVQKTNEINCLSYIIVCCLFLDYLKCKSKITVIQLHIWNKSLME